MANYKERIIVVLLNLALVVGKAIVSVLVAWLVSLQLIPMGAAERGFEGAIGGEHLLIVCAGILTYYLLTQIVNWFRS